MDATQIVEQWEKDVAADLGSKLQTEQWNRLHSWIQTLKGALKATPAAPKGQE